MAETSHAAYNIKRCDVGGFVMNDLYEKINDEPKASEVCDSLIQGYKEMSRINLGLAENAVASDNEALKLCEQIIAECE